MAHRHVVLRYVPLSGVGEGTMIRKFLSVSSIAMALAAAVPALADKPPAGGGWPGNSGPGGGSPGNVHQVPEFDASAVGVIAFLVAGGGILVARRRRR